MRKFRFLKYFLLAAAVLLAASSPLYPQSGKGGRAQTEKKASSGKGKKRSSSAATAKGSKAKKQSGGRAKDANASGQKKRSRQKSSSGANLSSTEVKRQQQAAEQEIKETKRKITENDRSIRANLSELQKIGSEIETSQKQISDMSAQVSKLNTDIGAIEASISEKEARLAQLRASYLATVKKMRLKRASDSKMAFLFSSGSFNEGLRRLRYLKKLSAWRDRQSAAIMQNVEALHKDRLQLADVKTEKSRTLVREQRVKSSLVAQQSQKDALVVKLRADGAALNAHLRNKQAEANALRSQVASLIAREEAQAAERRRAEQQRIENERRQEAERKERERREQEQRQQLLADNAAKEKGAAKDKPGKKSSSKDNKKKDAAGKEMAKNDYRNDAKKKKGGGNSEFATARKRRPRSESGTQSAPRESASAQPKASSKAKSATGFGASKGSLPRPVSGAFKVTSRFGRHEVPGLSGVVYDNPGIDAETSQGASAQAVYGGKVSGIYMIPGFNTVVIVNHGDYYTVYGNISSVSVRQGDSVRQGQKLGSLAYDADEKRTMIHFEVWKNRTKLNPQEWIR